MRQKICVATLAVWALHGCVLLGCVLLGGILLGVVAGTRSVQAQTPTAASGYTATNLTALVGSNVAALTYGPNGTLYVAQQGPADSSAATDLIIDAISPSGSMSTIDVTALQVNEYDIASMIWDPQGGLLVNDQTNGAIYSIPLTGASATPVVSNDYTIQQMVAPTTSDIYYSDAPYGGTGAVYDYNRTTTATTQVATVEVNHGTAGVGFDSSGNLIYQDVTYNGSGGAPAANVYSAQLAGSNPPTQLTSNTATFDLAVSSTNHVFLTGILPASSGPYAYSYGLYELNQTTSQVSTATNLIATIGTNSPYDYGTDLTYLPSSGKMAFILADYSGSSGAAGNYVVVVTPVPEPSTWALLALGVGGMLVGKRWRRGRRSH